METHETLGERMRRVREAQGIRIAALADTCLISEGSIRQIEGGGVRSPSLIVGLRIAKALNVDPYWLATGAAEPIEARVHSLEIRVAALERDRRPAPR
jgi:transcriptional regulator with XRE-family HTH domain